MQHAGNCPAKNIHFHPSLAHSQDCRIRIEAASKTDPTYRDRVERAEQGKMDFFAKEVEQMDHGRLKTAQVFERPNGLLEGQLKICQVKYPFQAPMSR